MRRFVLLLAVVFALVGAWLLLRSSAGEEASARAEPEPSLVFAQERDAQTPPAPERSPEPERPPEQPRSRAAPPASLSSGSSAPSTEAAQTTQPEPGEPVEPPEPTEARTDAGADSPSHSSDGGAFACSEAPLPERPPAVCSSPRGGPGHALFINTCADAEVEAFWVGFACEERPWFRLRPGDSIRLATHLGHRWRLRDASTRALLAEGEATEGLPVLMACPCAEAGILAEDAGPVPGTDWPSDAGLSHCDPFPIGPSAGLCSTQSGLPVSLTVRNTCSVPVRSLWLDFTCHEKPYALLQPGETYHQSTFVGHAWRFRDESTGALLREEVPSTPRPLAVSVCDCR